MFELLLDQRNDHSYVPSYVHILNAPFVPIYVAHLKFRESIKFFFDLIVMFCSTF